ncbi:hypothetical protein CHLNCDRAFT_51191 [Chlorella variabilis]|uniref:Chitin-binding type-2 domain-containing protein n=1 Tax=Chlorella variabilis TaxID=554065 RepID=E1ZAX0_CHLVA|nr:hypothetical protein CHLNCDRAFT_51191 [Chlorella variabilis]EFN57128.1 hypothetical protein CHLNCDRAFT_51191 [Chlorella variabilis]|eukprot:XP_005849230.1 hypothetical protein CHLNCDRAFT_51191 [Chlorella variabilis]
MAHLGLASHDLHGSILLRDSLDLQASFLLAQLIKTALEGGADAAAHVGPAAAPAARCRRRVVLLAAQQAASHYAQVLRKAGLQVPALLASGQLTVLDLLPSLGSGLPPLHALHRQLAAAVASGGGGGDGGGGHACLVADDLSSRQDWDTFLHACIVLGQAPGCCFIGLAHGDVAAGEGWLARLEHAATLVLDVEPLEPGRPGAGSSAGRLAITRRDACQATAAAAAGHGFMTAPVARNVLRGAACGVGCPHCCNFGGPGTSSAGGRLTWPASAAPACGTLDLNTAGPVMGSNAPGAVIKLTIFISAQHGGRHLFRLCPGPDATKPCFTQHTLQRVDGSGPYVWTPLQGGPVPEAEYSQGVRSGVSGELYTWRFRLPEGVACERCVLQWWWTTANSCRVPGAPGYVGGDPGMSMCNTPGPFPEEFYNCADIRIAPGGSDAGDAPWRPWPQFPLPVALQQELARGRTGSTAEPTTAELLQMQQQAGQQQQQPQQQQQQQQAGGMGPRPRVGPILGPPDGLPADVLAALAALRGTVDEPWATHLCRGYGNGVSASGRYFSVQRDCSLFLTCGPSEGWILACPQGLLWDDTQKSCNFPALTECGSRPPLPAPLRERELCYVPGADIRKPQGIALSIVAF